MTFNASDVMFQAFVDNKCTEWIPSGDVFMRMSDEAAGNLIKSVVRYQVQLANERAQVEESAPFAYVAAGGPATVRFDQFEARLLDAIQAAVTGGVDTPCMIVFDHNRVCMERRYSSHEHNTATAWRDLEEVDVVVVCDNGCCTMVSDG